MTLRRTLARNTLANWLQFGLSVVIAVGLTPVYLTGLGPSRFGVWMLLTQLAGYASLLDLGLQTTVSRKVAAAVAVSRRDGLGAFLSTALSVQVMAGGLVMGAAIAAGRYLSSWFDLGEVSRGEAYGSLLFLALATATGYVTALFGAVLTGLYRTDLVAALTAITQIVRAGGMLLALAVSQGIAGFGLAAAVSGAAGSVGTYLVAARVGRGLALRPGVLESASLREIVGVGGYLLLGTIGWRLSFGTDLLVAGAFLSSSDTGHFAVALTVLTVVSSVVAGFTGTLVPVASASAARHDQEAGPRRFLLATRAAVYVGLPLIVALVVSGPELLVVWVGSAVGEPSGRILQVLAVAHVFITCSSAAIPMALGYGLHRKAAIIALSEGIANLLLSCVLVTRLGTLGIAIGTAIPAALFHGLIWPRAVQKRLGLSWQRYLREALVPNGPALLSALVLVYLVRLAWPATRHGALIVATLLVLTYWGVGLFTCYSGEDRHHLARQIRGFFRPGPE